MNSDLRFLFKVWSVVGKKMINSWDVDLLRDYLYGALIDEGYFQHYFYRGQYITLQSTGLKDKNGKLIYEGDILLSLATKSHTGVVCWDKEKAYFKINGKGIAYNALQTLHSENAFEVIGNIYENPELLEEQCANQLNKG